MSGSGSSKHNVASALRANRVYVCERSYRSDHGAKRLTERADQVTYMNKGGTAERIGPCEEGLIVPAVLHFYTEKGESSWQRKRS